MLRRGDIAAIIAGFPGPPAKAIGFQIVSPAPPGFACPSPVAYSCIGRIVRLGRNPALHRRPAMSPFLLEEILSWRTVAPSVALNARLN